MSVLKYKNFDVLIHQGENGYAIRSEADEVGVAYCDFKFPFSENKLKSLISKFSPLQLSASDTAKALGGQLFKRAFGDKVGRALERSITSAEQDGERVRIRLRLTEVPELARLPWEYLYDKDNDRFLVLSYKTSIVRYLDIPQRVTPLAVKPPLRILVMASSPLDGTPLSIEREWKNLQKAFSKMPSGLVEVERLKKPTLGALRERLSQGDEFHVFHYIGHSNFDQQSNQSVLVMEDEKRQSSLVNGERLGVVLHNHNSLRLATLNSCKGAVANSHNVFTGVAQNLIRHELPAVIAMQFEITDACAVILAKAFYESLALGNPLDTAVAEARLAIFTEDNNVEWGTPVLYLRANDGQIFELQQATDKDDYIPTPAPKLSTALETKIIPPLEPPGGTMHAQSLFYVARASDAIALDRIQRQGMTFSILSPLQGGKSSLLIRVLEAANSIGKHVTRIDFQQFGAVSISQADSFFPLFCSLITTEMDLDDQVSDFFEKNRSMSPVQKCTRYVGTHILQRLNKPLVLAMEEVDIIYAASFSSDFFAMLRSWHNNRAFNPYWKHLDLVLVTSIEPHFFIDNLSQSPFNVGEIIQLEDFTQDQIADLNLRYGSPFSLEQEHKLAKLVGGHPYLVQQALYEVASHHISADSIFARATDNDGPFGKHLRTLLMRLQKSPELAIGLRQVIKDRGRPDERLLYRLQADGFVRQEARIWVPRCQLYADYFREHLHG